MIGVAFRSSAWTTSRPGRRACASARASASRRIRSDRVRLPLVISLAVKRAVVRLAGTVWYLVLRGMLMRRGILGAAPRPGGLGAGLAATPLAGAHPRCGAGPPAEVGLYRRP